ncbi:MAG: hypothetical protein EU541_07125 [Promethearchaeota archaeon]|nr:MAG: hypothetical protein EU541_07125 [Candidatus Lokiarchaeota archaeon]
MIQNTEIIPSLYNATDNLVRQQFYIEGKDTIMGRTPEIRVKIQYSGQIISKFKSLFNKNLELFLNRKYHQFLKKFIKVSGITESLIEETYIELKSRFSRLEGNLSNSKESQVVLYTIFMGTIISKIREIHFENLLQIIRERIKRKNKDISELQIEKELGSLFQTNNENVSILYNLSYLYALADTYNYKQVKRVCRIQQTKYINKLIYLIQSRLQ